MLIRSIGFFLILNAGVAVSASEIQGLRLFFDTDSVNASTKTVDVPAQLPADFESPSKPKLKFTNPFVQFKYNGFISSAEGDHFFINGKSHKDTDRYKIVSVFNGGRLLELKLDNGNHVLIRIGQTIQVESL